MDHYGTAQQNYQQQQQQQQQHQQQQNLQHQQNNLGNPTARDQIDTFREVLESVLEGYRQLGIVVSDVQPTSQAVVNEKLSQLIVGLKHLDAAKVSLGELRVPFEVVQYVDEGKNPQSYTKDCMEKAMQKNEEVKGKIDAFKKFRAYLLVELSKSFPNEMAKYRSLRPSDIVIEK